MELLVHSNSSNVLVVVLGVIREALDLISSSDNNAIDDAQLEDTNSPVDESWQQSIITEIILNPACLPALFRY